MESEVYIPVFCKRGKLQHIEKRNGLGVNTRWIDFLLAIRSKHLQCFDLVVRTLILRQLGDAQK